MPVYPLGRASEWKNGEMKEVTLPQTDETVLVSRVDNQFFTTGARCTHYGADLASGVLSNCRVICPWHGAAFDVCTGDIEDAPGLNKLATFRTFNRSGTVYVEVPKTVNAIEIDDGIPPPEAPLAARIESGILIIGGGAAGAVCAEELRLNDYKGPITILSKSLYRPIDRPKLSKSLMSDPDMLALRSPDFYSTRGIRLRLGADVSSVNFAEKYAVLVNAEQIPYENVVIATGATARRLPIEGHSLGNVHTMREIEDIIAIDHILETDSQRKIVIVGASFIAMETAGACAKRGVQATVCGPDKVPFERILGTDIGKAIQKYHESTGIKFFLGDGVKRFIPNKANPDLVGAVEMASGAILDADLVLLGVGARPATDLLAKAGLGLLRDGSIEVDEQFRITQVPDKSAYAVGDIANYPHPIGKNRIRIEHWNVASNQGRHAARAILGIEGPFDHAAYFWSAHKHAIRYVGTHNSTQWKDVYFVGDVSELDFVAYYYKEDEIVAVASMQNDPIVSYAAELVRQNRLPSMSWIKEGYSIEEIPLSDDIVPAL